MEEKKWDIFISHASEDKVTVARPLAAALRRAGVRVWLDEHELRVGDSLSEKVDEGLSQSRFGVVILSPGFFAKHWPRRELAGLRASEEDGQKVILPIWHNVNKSMVREFSPILADVLAADTEQGIEWVTQRLLDVIFAPASDSPSKRSPSVTRRLVEILESNPNKSAFLDFLRFHVPRTSVYLGWGSYEVFETYRLYDVEFDAYAPYAGHGVRLTLVAFTSVWANPFELDQDSVPRIRAEIVDAFGKIKTVQSRFEHDGELQASMRDTLVSEHLPYFPPDYFEALVPTLEFFVYAGRRSKIDLNATTHSAWSQLRNDGGDSINIKTYDSIIDTFQGV